MRDPLPLISVARTTHEGSGVVELSAASIGSVGQVGSLVLPALRPQALNPRSMSGAATKPRMLASFSKRAADHLLASCLLPSACSHR